MNTFNKAERLCNKTLFEELLASGIGFIKYPYRIVAKKSSVPGEFPARIAISVSKKKFTRAVKRNRIKRLTREAFRCNKHLFYEQAEHQTTVDLLFIYLDNRIYNLPKLENAMQDALRKVSSLFSQITAHE